MRSRRPSKPAPLRAAGVTQLHGNDSSEAWCTVHNPLLFFSHRRDRVSGRFAACIWRD
jgi:copper oxidase (laccase) domain-containing protein